MVCTPERTQHIYAAEKNEREIKSAYLSILNEMSLGLS